MILNEDNSHSILYAIFSTTLLFLCIVIPHAIVPISMPALFLSTLFVLEINTPLAPPIISVLLLGFLEDALSHMPFGTYSLTFMLFYIQLLFAMPYLIKYNFFRSWFVFCITLLLTGIEMYILSKVFNLSWNTHTLFDIFFWSFCLFPVIFYVSTLFKSRS